MFQPDETSESRLFALNVINWVVVSNMSGIFIPNLGEMIQFG